MCSWSVLPASGSDGCGQISGKPSDEESVAADWDIKKEQGKNPPVRPDISPAECFD
jgi:hypothetical protein